MVTRYIFSSPSKSFIKDNISPDYPVGLYNNSPVLIGKNGKDRYFFPHEELFALSVKVSKVFNKKPPTDKYFLVTEISFTHSRLLLGNKGEFEMYDIGDQSYVSDGGIRDALIGLFAGSECAARYLGRMEYGTKFPYVHGGLGSATFHLNEEQYNEIKKYVEFYEEGCNAGDALYSLIGGIWTAPQKSCISFVDGGYQKIGLGSFMKFFGEDFVSWCVKADGVVCPYVSIAQDDFSLSSQIGALSSAMWKMFSKLIQNTFYTKPSDINLAEIYYFGVHKIGNTVQSVTFGDSILVNDTYFCQNSQCDDIYKRGVVLDGNGICSIDTTVTGEDFAAQVWNN